MITFDTIRVSEKFTWKFENISAEEYRVYHFKSWLNLKVERPVAIYKSETWHRIICEDWTSRYVFLGDVVMITFKVKEWLNHFDI